MTSDEQMQLHFGGLNLPPSDEMSLNVLRPKTWHWIQQDFANSKLFTIITGYSSLEFLLHFFHREPVNSTRNTRLLIGHEDIRMDQVKHLPKVDLSQEMRDFWLNQRISIEHCGAVLHMIALIESSKIDVRILSGLHAKIYVGDSHAMLGSSNFSWNGLKTQKEANIRVRNTQPRYTQIKQAADYYFEQGLDYNDKFIDLLKALLKNVTWQEALARSATLLIEGDWWKRYTEMEATLREFNLWPTQEQAIGRALYVLDNHGSVLVADPTGSGKTRLGMALHLTLMHRLWATGRGRRVNGVLLSPPRVIDNWQGEYLQANSDFSNIVSHGTLSSGKKEAKEEALLRIRNANIFMIDEAHNFINKQTNRSREIAKNLAEHIILFTATPINRQKEDLFRMIELLDIDNFPDEIIKTYKKYAFKKSELRGSELAQFKKVLHQFVVRRTKNELNQMIWREPEKYRNRLGNHCMYPEQYEQTYPLLETNADIEIAEKINKISNELVGITRLHKLKPIHARHLSAEDQQAYLELRQKSAAALSRYMVQAMLRSSKAALVEHIYGSEAAKNLFDLKGLPKNKDSGNVIRSIQKLRDKLPESNLKKIELPQWMQDLKTYQQICDAEIHRYEEIGKLTKELSDRRAKGRMQQVLRLLEEHKRIVAFDHHVISLYYLQKLLKKELDPKKIVLVTGGKKQDGHIAKKIFGLASEEEGYLGLFSDAMSEGVNLQGASALIFLDMPSVVRLAEQRIGRIDRMDSPHKIIEIFWPDDHPAFALKTDRRFFKTTRDVDSLLGSNFRIPEQLTKSDFGQETTITAKEGIQMREEFSKEQEKQMQDLFADAFQSVEELVLGEEALIGAEIYEQIRFSKARVYANVSIVRSSAYWAFFALEGVFNTAPRWIFIDDSKQIHTDLPSISRQLRSWLPQSENVQNWNKEVDQQLTQFTRILQHAQLEQLPLKKKRAILLLQELLKKYKREKDITFQRKHLLNQLQEKLQVEESSDYSPDFDDFGKTLTRYFQPYLQQLREASPRKVILLNDLKKLFLETPIPDTDLEKLLDAIRWVRSINRRVVACIIGVGN